jgi:hypothetical protein
MSPHEFFERWTPELRTESRERFLVELAMLLTLEQARERHLLCTDARLYREACETTAADLRRRDLSASLKATA